MRTPSVCKNGAIDGCTVDSEDGTTDPNQDLRLTESCLGQLGQPSLCREMWPFESNWVEK